jgi:hypothetical protein
MERIIEAIALTLPSGGNNVSHNSSLIGTLTSGANADYESGLAMKFDDNCIRELAFDLGVDPRALKSQLSKIFTA